MKIVGTLQRIRDNVVAIESPYPINLDESKKYCIDIKEYRSKRSSEQNRYMWLLITEIVRKENGGYYNTELRNKLYTNLLKEAGAVEIHCEIEPKDLERFKLSFSATDIEGTNEINGKIKAIAYIGTSQMNTKEMSNFIDYVLDYASQVGIYTEYWEGLLK